MEEVKKYYTMFASFACLYLAAMRKKIRRSEKRVRRVPGSLWGVNWRSGKWMEQKKKVKKRCRSYWKWDCAGLSWSQLNEPYGKWLREVSEWMNEGWNEWVHTGISGRGWLLQSVILMVRLTLPHNVKQISSPQCLKGHFIQSTDKFNHYFFHSEAAVEVD